MTDTIEAGRLALRVEGHLWCAYYAQPNTMDGAIFLGSIQVRFVLDKEHKDMFMWLMREAVADILEQNFGQRPDWREPRRAPEHERGKPTSAA
jgi:hypothetical protein